MKQSSVVNPPTERLGTTFHRTFPFDRSIVARIMQLAADAPNSGCTDRDTITNATTLGTIKVEAFPRWGFGAGVLSRQICLTPLGRLVAVHDDGMNRGDTLWLLHYHLSAPSGPGPRFWSDLVYHFFRPGMQFTRDQIREAIVESVLRADGKRINPDATAAVFLGTYSRDEGLGKLGILREQGRDAYQVLWPTPPDPWALAFAFVHWWGTQYGDRRTINMADIGAEGGFADLFLLGNDDVEKMLRAMQQAGDLEVHRIAQPYQVILHNRDLHVILGRLYGTSHSG